MCSWDTDCNASNVGTILGVARGLDGIPGRYRDPLEDELVLSGISGYLNVLDIPSYAKSLASWAYRLQGLPVPQECEPPRRGEILFDFSLPGATHSLKYRGTNDILFRRSKDKPAVEAVLDRLTRGQGGRIYYKSLWRRSDFDDERYMPVFSPTVYPGQQIEISLSYEKTHGEAIQITPYVKTALSQRELRMAPLLWRGSVAHHSLSFTVPDLEGDMAQEVGLHIESASPPKFFDAGRVMIERFHAHGPANFTLKVGNLPKEFGSVLGFSHNHGAWDVQDGEVHCLSDGHAEMMTGSYYLGDCTLKGAVRPYNGASHLVGIHVQGAQRGYYGGLGDQHQAVLFKNNHGNLEQLAACSFRWTPGETYTISLSHMAGQLSLSINGQHLLDAADAAFGYGMAGYAIYGIGRCGFGDISICEKGAPRYDDQK